MNLKQLAHVLALADTLSFNQAARMVHLSQSALSKSIAALEAELGIQIFERSTSRVEVAATGAHVVALARHLMSEATNFRKSIEYLKTGELGSVAVGSGPFPAACFLEAGIRAFHKRHPTVSMSLRIDNWGNLLQGLLACELDFFMADIRNLEDDSRLDITPIGGVTVALCCCREHPLLAGDPARAIDPRELLQYTFATVKLPPLMFLELKQSMGLDRNDTFAVNIECDDIALLNRILPGSDIILATSNLMMDGCFRNPGLVKLNVSMARNRFGEWALVKIKGRTLTPSAALLADLLTDLIRRGSLSDNARYGLAQNTPLNFVEPRHTRPHAG